MVNSDYSPYGEVVSATETIENPWQYVGRHGQHQDPTGLAKVGHRYLDTDLGRWTQTDPIAMVLALAQHAINWVV